MWTKGVLLVLTHCHIAIEHGHRNSWFTYEKWWFSMVMLVYQSVVHTSLVHQNLGLKSWPSYEQLLCAVLLQAPSLLSPRPSECPAQKSPQGFAAIPNSHLRVYFPFQMKITKLFLSNTLFLSVRTFVSSTIEASMDSPPSFRHDMPKSNAISNTEFTIQ